LDKLPPIEWNPTYQALIKHLKEQQRLNHRLPTKEDILSIENRGVDDVCHTAGRLYDKMNDD